MSYSIDVNILVYASDQNSPFHSRAARFLDACASGHEPFYLSWLTLMGYFRIATHPAIFSHPLAPAEAAANVEMLLSLPHVRLLSERAGFWSTFQEVTRGLEVRGNLIPDAHLAALLRQHRVSVLYSNDSDFQRFSALELRNPLA